MVGNQVDQLAAGGLAAKKRKVAAARGEFRVHGTQAAPRET